MIPKFLKVIANKVLNKNLLIEIKKRLVLKRILVGKYTKEPELYILDRFISNNSVVLDIGANYGYYTRQFSSLVGNKGKVYSFEPIFETYQCLKYVKHKLNWDNVNVFNYALGNINDDCEMVVPLDNNGSEVLGLAHLSGDHGNGHANSYQVQIRCLDDLHLKLKGLAFIKCDVEGSELKVIKGAQSTLKKFMPILLIEIEEEYLNRLQASSNDIFSYLFSLGYEAYYFNKKTLIQCANIVKGYNNYFFLPKDRTDIIIAFDRKS